MSQQKTYTGSCFCGAVKLAVTGEPEGMGFCHCDSCRRWSAGPVNAFTLWKPERMKVTHGAEHVGKFESSPKCHHHWCTVCGGHLFADHPEMELIDIYAAVIPDFPFKPGVHVHYQETVLPMADGVTKFRDLPGEAGGSGEVMPEQSSR
ncbi:MAG: aldehyde-activating protein [Betaproteobacteria bacterium SG8_41]|jgi:hypothetical protein|nr:MAG: aldehyde-activating protein [Betaproteobacteria bacterium SG8_41]KPK69629.1 MAG: aldehyde-activating protein [Acidithiobacillales bacterium SM23_46]